MSSNRKIGIVALGAVPRRPACHPSTTSSSFVDGLAEHLDQVARRRLTPCVPTDVPMTSAPIRRCGAAGLADSRRAVRIVTHSHA